MGFFRDLKDRIFFTNTQKYLNPGNDIEIDRSISRDTIPLILIETLEYILKDDDAYKRFKKMDKYFFENGITVNDYKKAFCSYTEFLLRRDVPFSQKELKRIQKITGKKYISTKGNKGERQTALSLAGKMIRDPILLQEFQKQNDQDQYLMFQNVNPDDIKQELLNSFRNLATETNNVYSFRLNLYEREISQSKSAYGEYFAESVKQRVDENKTINTNFKKLVMSKVPEGIKDKEELAYCIYNALNESLLYDSTYFALDRDKSNENIRNLFRKDISNITPEDNTVICAQWAELYSYFLKVYGIDSVVVSDIYKIPTKDINGEKVKTGVGVHKYVEIYVDNQIIKADATNVTYSEQDRTNMSDLTRAKIGIVPAGFKSRNCKELAKKYKNKTIADKMNDIRSLISREEKSNATKNLDSIAEVKRRLEIISEQIKASNLDNFANLQYIRTLYSICLGDFRKITSINHSLYSQDKNGRCFIKPVISINVRYRGKSYIQICYFK